jgi:hypothetical protein
MAGLTPLPLKEGTFSLVKYNRLGVTFSLVIDSILERIFIASLQSPQGCPLFTSLSAHSYRLTCVAAAK